MTKIKQLSKSEKNNNKMLPSTDKGSTVSTSGTQQLKSTVAVIQQYKQKPTANENHITSQQLEPRLVNNDYFVLDGPLVNRREATEQQSLHTISVTLSFAQNLSSLFTCHRHQLSSSTLNWSAKRCTSSGSTRQRRTSKKTTRL